jgi:hypothetical protein
VIEIRPVFALEDFGDVGRSESFRS